MKTIEELERELSYAKRQEAEKKEQENRQKNYEYFQKREEDAIIGLSHCDIWRYDNNWYECKRRHTIWDTISIHWNCGDDYDANIAVTNATYTYFHNVRTDKQRKNFQKILNKVAIKEIRKIMWSLEVVLEIMWLQSNDYHLKTIYPSDKNEEIKESIENEQKKILDKYTDKEIKKVISSKNLCHSNTILFNYINKNRPSLLQFIKD